MLTDNYESKAFREWLLKEVVRTPGFARRLLKLDADVKAPVAPEGRRYDEQQFARNLAEWR